MNLLAPHRRACRAAGIAADAARVATCRQMVACPARADRRPARRRRCAGVPRCARVRHCLRPAAAGPGSCSALGACTMCCAPATRAVRCARAGHHRGGGRANEPLGRLRGMPCARGGRRCGPAGALTPEWPQVAATPAWVRPPDATPYSPPLYSAPPGPLYKMCYLRDLGCGKETVLGARSYHIHSHDGGWGVWSNGPERRYGGSLCFRAAHCTVRRDGCGPGRSSPPLQHGAAARVGASPRHRSRTPQTFPTLAAAHSVERVVLQELAPQRAATDHEVPWERLGWVNPALCC